MSEIKWIKIATNIFDNRKIKLIMSDTDGDMLILIWLQLLCLAGSVNDSGLLYVTKKIPYTIDMLATQFGRSPAKMQKAMRTFEQFGMVDKQDDFFHITNWSKYQSENRLASIREYNRESQKKSRTKNKNVNDMSMTETENVNDLSLTKSQNVNDMSMTKVQNVIDKSLTNRAIEEEEEEEEEEREKDIHSFIHSIEAKRELLRGDLGGGVVMLSDEQIDSLLEILSLDEFNHYVAVVRDCELSGKPFRKKTHYQAILDMAKKDRRTV